MFLSLSDPLSSSRLPLSLPHLSLSFSKFSTSRVHAATTTTSWRNPNTVICDGLRVHPFHPSLPRRDSPHRVLPRPSVLKGEGNRFDLRIIPFWTPGERLDHKMKKRETIMEYLSEKTTTKKVALRLHTICVQLSEGADTAQKGPCIARRCSCDSPSRVTASFTPTKSLLVNILKSWSYIKGRRVLHGPFSSIYLS